MSDPKSGNGASNYVGAGVKDNSSVDSSTIKSSSIPDVEQSNLSNTPNTNSNAIDTAQNAKVKKADVLDLSLDQEFLDTRTITIRNKDSQSMYFKQNMKFMPAKKCTISASIRAVDSMVSSLAELEAYLPSIIGIDKNNPSFYSSVRNYFNGFSVLVPDNDLELDCSFVFRYKRDYLIYKAAFDKILDEFSKTDKSNPETRDKSFSLRDSQIIALEKAQLGKGVPVNIANYVLYRYCLLYPRIANDIALINSAGNIDFYMVDKRLEKNYEAYMFAVKQQSRKLFMEISEDKTKLADVLYASGVYNVHNMSYEQQVTNLETLQTSNISKFIELGSDRRLSDKAFIERAIQNGLLRRAPNTNVIRNVDEEVIANSLQEAIDYINLPTNAGIVSRWRTSLNRNI